MRITGGLLRGRKLPLQKGEMVRPTSDRVREALFSILGQNMEGCKVLDVYGGSGILSFESLSRGAESAVIFDKDKRAVQQCSEVSAALGLTDRVKIRRGAVPKCLPVSGQFEIIFVDPPYTQDAGPVLIRLTPLLSGVLVLEHQNPAPESPGLLCVDQRQYGNTLLSFFRVKGDGPCL
jgi:16S rRNA (guanine966-N2)-methyltransferase